MEYENGAIYADADGCLYNFYLGKFFAFGRSEPLDIRELTGNDEPTILVFDRYGKLYVDRLAYAGGDNIRG